MSYIDIKVLSNETLRSEYEIDFEKNITSSFGATIISDLFVSNSCDFDSSVQFSGSNIFLKRVVNFTSSQEIDFNGTLKISGSRIIIPSTYTPPSSNDELNIQLGIELEDTRFYKDDNTIAAYTGFGDNGLFIGDISPAGYLAVSGTFYANPLYFDGTNVGIGSDSPSANLTVKGDISGDIGSLITDGNVFLNSTRGSSEVVSWQMIGQYNLTFEGFTNWDTYTQGLLFTDGTNLSNKHWFITPIHDGVPSSPTGIVENSIAFCYINSTTTTPVATMAGVNTYRIGYIPIDNSGFDPPGAIDFTGQHRNQPYDSDLSFYADKAGLIVASAGVYCDTMDHKDEENTTISINESLPKVKLTSTRNDKKVFGVISNIEDTEDESRQINSGRWCSVMIKKPNDNRLIINSVGEGAIWICNINGNLENGDYITSCEVPGFGMKQEAQNVKNYTVAKITCDCDFNLDSNIYRCEEFQFSGSTYRKAFVGCTYHCG
jgi:hypothetical protein